MRDALGPLFIDEDFTTEAFAGMFPDNGQPGLSPAVLAMVTVLQSKNRLSDRAAAEAVADRISWKYMLGVELECTGFDFSALSEFRDRLAESGRADALLGVVLDRLKDAGLLRERGRARTDATQMLGAVRVLNRIETCGETLRVALEAIAEVSAGFVVPLSDAGWHERYSRRVETGRLLGRGGSKAAADALAGQIGADGAAVLARIGAEKAVWADLLPEVRILRVVWDQQYEQVDGVWLLKAAADPAPSAQRIHSPHDPEVRYSAKGRPGGEPDTEWVGTKFHLTESSDDDLPHLITDVHTTVATDPDVTATTDIQDKLIGRRLAPGEHLMDAGYPSAENFAASAARGITLIAPVITATGRKAGSGTFSPLDFNVDWDAGTATCPDGAVSRSMRVETRGLVTFAFSRRDCVPCPIRDQCTTAKPPSPRRITVHPQPIHEARLRAYHAEHAEGWQQLYNQRAGVEGTISQAVRRTGLRRARYRGLAKTHVQNVVGGIAINLCRLGAHYADRPKTPRPPTRIHRLCAEHDIIPATI